MEALIIAGLRRLVGEMAKAASGTTRASAHGGAARRLTRLAAAAGTRARGVCMAAAEWAAGRSPCLNAIAGISLLLALCASAWFSGGAGSDYLDGAVAVGGLLLARACAWWLAELTERRAGRSLRPPAPQGGSAGGSTDWLILPGAVWVEDGLAGAGGGEGRVRLVNGTAVGGRGRAARARTVRAAVSSPGASSPGSGAGVSGAGVSSAGVSSAGAGSAAISRRAAVGAAATGTARAETGTRSPVPVRDFGWLWAVTAVAAECAIYGGIAAGGQSFGWLGMWPLAVAVVASAAVADAITVCSRAAVAGGLRRPDLRNSAIGRLTSRVVAPSASLRVALATLGLAIHGPRVALFTVLAVEVASICYAVASLGKLSPAGRIGLARPEAILVCRDDGAVAAWAGRLVQGSLPPLPPALAGVTGAVLLAMLGLRSSLGGVALAPLMVMLLAAPGSGHPHDGRFDWLLPPLLALGQYVYLAALGFAWKVPGSVVFSLCALTALWQASLAVSASRAAPATGQRRVPASARSSSGIGWELRLFAAGLSAIFGIATFGYVGLAAYLGLLIGRTVVTGYLMPVEDSGR